MKKLLESNRLHAVEKQWDTPIKKLFYKWHWKENLRHREIAEKVALPRPTVTRWFKELNIPSQPSTRFTNFNLLNVGPIKSPPARPKIKKLRPWNVNTNFFNRWSPEMAYILGFFCADGNMNVNHRGSCYISFNITDKELLKKIAAFLGSGHKIALKKLRVKQPNWKPSWSLQIGSKEIYRRLIQLGITPAKAKRLRIPTVPNRYLSDFVRGYFDGDGSIWFGLVRKNDRPNPTKALVTSFVSSSKGMLLDIVGVLHNEAGTRLKSLSFHTGAYRLYYSTIDSRKIYAFLYRNNHALSLERKKVVFEKYLGP